MKEAIVIIGGYGSLWPAYLGMARRLEDLSGLETIGVPLMPWHWWRAHRTQDATDILRKLEETIVWARRRFGADRFILVGHSAGGLIARLYLSQAPVWGHTYGAGEEVVAIISLGSPHCSDRGTQTGWFLADQANRLVPSSEQNTTTRYLAVCGRAIQGHRTGTMRQRRAFRNYRFFAGQGDLWGDGTVPLPSARLDGAPTLVLDGIVHSLRQGRSWYGGSIPIIRRWWVDGTGYGV